MEPVAAPDIPGFRCLERIAAGRHGAVWRSERLADGAPAAVKLLPADADAARFQREAAVLAGIDHPHIVRCLGSGTAPAGPWLAMELAAADASALVRAGPLPARRCLEIARDAARGLAELARRGLVHRDLSPANLLLMPDGRCVLGDFGLVAETATAPGEVAGTPAYLAPEQARGESASAATDIHALGACLYALATGQPPFHGESAWAVLQQAAAGRFPDPRASATGVAPGLRAIIRAATAGLPWQRYASAANLAADAEAVLAGGIPRHAGEILTVSGREPAPPRAAWRPGAGSALAAGAVLGFGLGWLLLRDDPDEAADFATARATGTATAWQAYIVRHPDAPGTGIAREAVRRLAALPPSSAPAERDRLAQQDAALASEIEALRAAGAGP